MAGYLVSDNRKVTTHRFMEMKQKGEKPRQTGQRPVFGNERKPLY